MKTKPRKPVQGDESTHGAVSRRAFLKSAAASATAATVLPGCASLGRREATGPIIFAPKTEKVRLAFIGTGGIGEYHLESTQDMGIECPCYCDVDTNRMSKAAELHPNARPYQDYRLMLDLQRDHIDGVMIGVPDHHHYPATIMAMKLGKHVYTQKPLAHTVWEARELAKAARKYRVATQMGNQGHAGEGWRLVYEWVHSGMLGHVREVHTWTDRPIWPQGVGRPEGEDDIPPNLNWECWVGPAPMRPYKGPEGGQGAGPYHWFNWRGWWDFGCGALGDMACHTMDGMFWAMDPGHCSSVEPLAYTPVNNETFPTSSMIKWEFPRPGLRRAFTAYWYDGGLLPTVPPELEMDRTLPSTGNLFIGSKASLLVSGDYGNSPRIFPESKMKKIGKPPKMLERSPGHIEEWIMACRGEKPLNFAKSNFSYAGPMTESILLGNVALRAGRRLEWDGKRMRFPNMPEADRYLTKEYREGWNL